MMNGIFGGMWFGWIFWIAVFALIIWIVVKFSNRDFPGRTNNNIEEETPLDILKKRYVKGEITKEEFEKMKKDLI